jgi:putative heme iron utilization protein
LNDLSSAQREYLALRNQAGNALLATIADDQTPAASYAPLAWLDGYCYLFLSELAIQTRNLKRCSSISLMLIEAEADAANPFARRRITMNGSVIVIARDDPLFEGYRTTSRFQPVPGLPAGGPLCAWFWSGL